MINGLRIVIGTDELRELVAERVRAQEEVVARYDKRLAERAGDDPDEVRAEDHFKTVPDLQAERQVHGDRVFQLTLIRDHLEPGERYSLGEEDLQFADLISSTCEKKRARELKCTAHALALIRDHPAGGRDITHIDV